MTSTQKEDYLTGKSGVGTYILFMVYPNEPSTTYFTPRVSLRMKCLVMCRCF